MEPTPQTAETKTVIISETVINDVLKYLGTKPYIEVANLISTLMNDHAKLNKVEPVKPTQPTPKQEDVAG